MAPTLKAMLRCGQQMHLKLVLADACQASSSIELESIRSCVDGSAIKRAGQGA
jgi:hypothetical protein